MRGPTLLPREDPKLAANGVMCTGSTVEYVPEVEDHLFANYSIRPSILGFRAVVRLSLLCAESDTDNTFGLSLLRFYFMDGFSADDYAPLQINMFYNAGAPLTGNWRGVYPKTSWAPKPVGPQTAYGIWQMDWELHSADLVNYLGINEWAAGAW